jgi:hypothetical protein
MAIRALLAILLLATLSAAEAPAVFQCIEFPYYSFPRQLWERELVWMKNIGIRSIEFTVPAGSSMQDLLTILRTLRKLEMNAWVRAANSSPQLAAFIEPHMQSHGGPVAYWGEQAAPQPVTKLSALSAKSLGLSRDALTAAHGTLIWTDVENTLTPDFHRGAISFAGDELPTLGQLRRDAALLGYWASGIGSLTDEREVQPVAGKLPEGVTARQLTGTASAVSIVNHSAAPYRGDLRVYYPPAKRTIALPTVQVAAGDSLWLPVNIPLAKGPFCKNCDALGNSDSVVYATAELTAVEFENGILAMEFNAPVAGEVVLHLAKEPSGPLLAAGKPTAFDWDESTGRARLTIPAGRGAANRVRIGLALDPPDSSAFFGDAKVLIIGDTNRITTSYSSLKVAGRSRLRAPNWLKAVPKTTSPLEIAYDITVPPDVLHGDHVELALEADGVQMGHARLQFLRPASLRIREAVNRHFGPTADLLVNPPLVPVDEKAGRAISVTIRNNYPEIRNYVLQISGEGLEFLPARTEISIGASSERDVSVRVFAQDQGLHGAVMHLTGGATLNVPANFVVIPRGGTVAYSADLHGDGRTEYVLESQHARAVFSSIKAERWLEFVWKDSERDVLPESGIALGPGTRTVSLKDAELTINPSEPLLKPGKQGDIVLQVQRDVSGRAVYSLSR